MDSRERVINTIKRIPVDRMPISGWVKENLHNEITERFGSVEAFEDRYEFDLVHLFGGPWPFRWEPLKKIRDQIGDVPLTPAQMLEVPLIDIDDMSHYKKIQDEIKFHKTERGRFIYIQTPGIFEIHNTVFGVNKRSGIENHLVYLLMYEDDLHQLYERQAQWNRKFALNCLDLGIDMIHVSDDWGGQNSLLFDPILWKRLIYPYHRITCDAVKERGGLLSLHSDGNISSIVNDIIELGYDVIHPWQESAGMSLDVFNDQYRDRITVMGGLDVQTTLGFGNYDQLETEIRRVIRMFKDGGLIFNTTHFVQAHCSIKELIFAYDLIYRLIREK